MDGVSTDELRRRADAGDARAMADLGARLLDGRHGPPSPQEGFARIAAACERGDPEAAAMTATLEGAGAGRPQNWQRALDFLQLAAERGSERAQAQLKLLSRSAFGSGDPGVWKRLRDGIDIQALVTSPAKRSLSESPRIRAIETFASDAECEWLMSQAGRRLAPAMVFDSATGAGRRETARSNSATELGLLDMDMVALVIRARISHAAGLPTPAFEPTQVLHYSVGQTFERHFDFLDVGEAGYARDVAWRGQRIATFLLYLNDGYQGGETDFPAAALRHRGRRGDGLLFANVDRSGAPDRLTLHAGLPPTAGEKWVLSQWIRDRAPGPVPPRE